MSVEEAINEAIDARLKELGLLEEKAATGKGGKGGKGGKKVEVEEPDNSEIDADGLKEKFVEFVNAKGKPEAKALLKKFKVPDLNSVPAKGYAKFADAIDAAMKPDDEAAGEEDLFGD